MTESQKADKMMSWFETLNNQQKNQVARHLFEHAVSSEWINIFDDEDIKELVEEGQSLEEVSMPYFTTCGQSLLNT